MAIGFTREIQYDQIRRFDNELGRGAFGRVVLGQDSQTRELVAIKEIQGNCSPVELNILGELTHENLVHLLGYNVTSRGLDIYMEYCEGGDLSKYTSKNDVPEQIVRKWAYDIIDLLRFLRTKRILHRDIKPKNILLVSSNSIEKIKVCDFGVAKILVDPSSSMTKSIVGSHNYMAPEIHQGIEYTYSADMWSLGVTLYEILFKKLPFQTIREILHSPLTFPENFEVSEQARNFLKKLLKKEPSRRLTIDAAMRHPFVSSFN